MKTCFLIMAIFCFFKTNGQITFQKIYSDSLSIAPLSFHITDDDGTIKASIKGYIAPPYPIGSIFLQKTDSVGNRVWIKSYDTIYNYVAPRSVIQTYDKGYAIAGVTINYDTSSHTGGAFLMKTDDTGKLLWLRCYGTGEENAMSVIQTKNKGFIVAGGNSSGNIYVVKTDSMGAVTWTKTYGDTMSGFYLARFIRETDDGGYILAGNAPTGIIPNDFMLMKIDSAGNFLWSKGYGGIYSEALSGFDITTDGFIMGGSSVSFSPPPHSKVYGYLIKTDNAGNVIWAKTYSKPNYGIAMGVMNTSDGGYIASVGATPDTQGLDANIVIVKLDNGGGIEWNKKIGQPNLNELGLVTGQTKDGGYLINGDLNLPAPPFNYDYAYLVKTDSLGDAGCYTDTFNLTVTNATPIVTPINLTVFGMSDSFTSLMPSTTNYSANDSILCYNDGSNAIHEVPPFTNEVSVFPNPSTGMVNIEANEKIDFIKITNAMGVTIYSSNPKTEKTFIDLRNNARGIYFYSVQSGGKTVRGKILLD